MAITKDSYNIKLQITDSGITTTYTCSAALQIGKVYKHAIENHYKRLAELRIQELTGGLIC